MAWSMIPTPGTKYGPCKEECSHKDCNQSRSIANKICPYCNQFIGYEKPFCIDENKNTCHYSCLIYDIEKGE